MPDECILKSSEIYQKLLSFRSDFITEKCLETHQAYALAQIKKARGRNKWINNPQPEEKPAPDKFCYVLSSQNDSKFPARPVKLCETALAISNLKASSVEHSDRVIVMYAGRVVESATRKELFKNPQHPYTKALLKAIPGAELRGQKLAEIPGRVPPATDFPEGCRFGPRSGFEHPEEAYRKKPAFKEISEGHWIEWCDHCQKGLKENSTATRELEA